METPHPDPFTLLIGVQLQESGPDRCRMRLPFRPALRTRGEVVHGGVIASLTDRAGVAAAWSNVTTSPSRGATADMTVSFLSAAEATDLFAEARVIRRSRSLVFVEIDVTSAAGQPVAKGLLTCKPGYGESGGCRPLSKPGALG